MSIDYIIALHGPIAQNYFDRIANATVDDRKAAASFLDAAANPDPIFSVDGSTATIEIQGLLSRGGPTGLDLYFGYGGTGYTAIIDAANELAANSSVTDVNINFNTGGGYIDGLDEAYQALLKLSKAKNVVAFNKGLIASAGYYLAVAASRIEAVSPAVETGSIGVKIVGYDWSEYLNKVGIKERVIVSVNAPKKSASIETEEGREQLLEELNAHERIFFMRVAEGRGVSVATVKKDFGQGAVLVAYDPDDSVDDAVSVGLIDFVALGSQSAAVFESGTGGAKSKTNLITVNSSVDDNKRGADLASMGTQQMSQTLKEILEKNPSAAVEYNDEVVAAEKRGRDTEVALNKSRVTFAAAALNSAKSYPKSVIGLAAKVMTGEIELSVLQAAMSSVDAVREELASSDAAEESAALGATGADGSAFSVAEGEEGQCQTEADFQATLKSSLSK